MGSIKGEKAIEKFMQTQNILFLIKGLGGGGAERVLVNLYKSFKNYKRHIIVFSEEKKYDINAKKILITCPPSISLINFLVRLYKIKKIKKTLKPTCAISFLEPANFYNVLSKTKNEKIILSFRNYYSIRLNPKKKQDLFKKLSLKLYAKLFSLLYNKADYFVAVSKGVAVDLIENFGLDPKKMKIIYNPIFYEEIQELSQENLYEYEKIFTHPVILTAGRLRRQKGQWYLLRIFKALKEKHKDLKLVILGEGRLKDYLVNLSQELKLKTYVWDRDIISGNYDVYFLGFQKNPFKFMARAKIFAFPSLWEGLGNVLFEAMTCGVPIISSDCRSGPREILAPNTDFYYQTDKPEFAEYGVLMPVFELKYKSADEPLNGKEKMWVEVIDRLLTDEKLRKTYAEKAKERAKDFRVEKILKQWEELLKL
uniref:Glycosyltransferase n=1 Tax=Thermodesulfobacterium geofontis TaxID=1295609 RepID=A0A7V4JPF2_9BACT